MTALLKRRRVLQAAASSMLPLSGALLAQETYPNKSIKIVVAFPAGGVADTSVRVLAEGLSASLKQAVVVDNKPGAIAQIAVNQVVQSPPDGYTLLNINNTMLAAQVSLKRFDLLKQLVPVCITGTTDGAFFCANAAPFQKVPELISWARANPGKLNYSSSGPGSLEHLYFASFAKKFGFTATHVPFKGGPDSMTAMAQNEIQIGAMPVPLILQFAGRVRPLASLVEKRNPLIPNAPTLKEQGIDFNIMRYWGAYAAPLGTPKAVIDVLQKHMGGVVTNSAYVAKTANLGMISVMGSAEDLQRTLVEDLKFLTAAVQDADLKLN